MRFNLETAPLTHTEGLVVATTQWLEESEKALLLVEEDRITNDFKNHRWQIIYVGRGNSIYEFPRDLGPATNYKGIEAFLLFSGGEDTVAYLMDMADAERDTNKLKLILAERASNSTLIQDAIQLEEVKRALVKRNSRTLPAQLGVVKERTLF